MFSIVSARTVATLSLAAALCFPGIVAARGVSPYLPLNLSPEIERQIDQVLLFAGQPTVRRPIAAATVLDALPEACKVDAALCRRVRKYLQAYMSRYAVTHGGIEAAATEDSTRTLPNSRGMLAEDAWVASLVAHYQPSDHVLVQLGGVAYPDEVTASGSLVSVGFEYAQLDVGFRDHWWSPMTDSSMLIGTQARTMPSITLSNYTPMTRLGLRYEMFMAQTTGDQDIVAQQTGIVTRGKPRFAGLMVSINPVRGWTLSASRILQYGGGDRDQSLSSLFRAFFDALGSDNTGTDADFGNQTAALTSQFVFPTRYPFAVYFQYAGEDGSRKEGWRMGNAALSAGLDLPRLWDRFDLTYEVSEWQNSWFQHRIYPTGHSNDGDALGQWGGDDRVPGDDAGAQSHSLRIGWAPSFGGRAELRYRTLANEDYSLFFDYEREHEVSLRYSRSTHQFVYGAQIDVGRDVFGEDFGRIGGFVRFTPGEPEFGLGYTQTSGDDVRRRVQVFVDAGLSASRLEFDPSDKNVTPQRKVSTVGPHVGVGVRGAVSPRSDLGTRLELDHVDGGLMLGVRALDYRYRIGEKLALTAFAGAVRYEAETPAYGYYGGVGAQWRDVISGFDLNLDLRATDKVARDAILPTDPVSVWSDVIYQIYSANLYLSYRF